MKFLRSKTAEVHVKELSVRRVRPFGVSASLKFNLKVSGEEEGTIFLTSATMPGWREIHSYLVT